jgi:hypothetical protein
MRTVSVRRSGTQQWLNNAPFLYPLGSHETSFIENSFLSIRHKSIFSKCHGEQNAGMV